DRREDVRRGEDHRGGHRLRHRDRDQPRNRRAIQPPGAGGGSTGLPWLRSREPRYPRLPAGSPLTLREERPFPLLAFFSRFAAIQRTSPPVPGHNIWDTDLT